MVPANGMHPCQGVGYTKVIHFMDAAMLTSFHELDTWFKLRFLGSLGGLALEVVLSWGLARACEIPSCSNLLVSYCTIVCS